MKMIRLLTAVTKGRLAMRTKPQVPPLRFFQHGRVPQFEPNGLYLGRQRRAKPIQIALLYPSKSKGRLRLSFSAQVEPIGLNLGHPSVQEESDFVHRD